MDLVRSLPGMMSFMCTTFLRAQREKEKQTDFA